ncbi:hypothetical protein N5079_03600 [Planotetraspora sp. A-T 1434]|uniref:hypothetical protein n=1 Tax=Planotetraspora sp. A-T 1434 TaxID=2979219 RepID=UPI0021BE166E|nr:hypothetical protein [Planotetraspora sp. A-T 1434]MCT9929299.1 hypothetical protein [Planotetraspora sp. A-T 1434]
MLRRVLALTGGAVLACAAALASTSPAQASTNVTFGPTSIGEYCHAQVSSFAWIGFDRGSIQCYGGNGNQYAGSGSPYAACDYLTTGVVLSASRGASDSLVCEIQ